MPQAPLYVAPDGSNRWSYSYSAGQDFSKCPRLFELKRCLGWKERETRAALEFGKVCESALTFFHTHGCEPGSGVKEFQTAWPLWKNAELTYSDTERDWDTLYWVGSELLALYEIQILTGQLKFDNPKFQVNYRTKLWPDDDKYGKLSTNHYIDMLLPDMIVDIKTTSKDYPESPKGWPAKDDQLRHYSFETGIRNVAFLVLVKVCSAIKKGDEVTFLQDHGEKKAGDKAWVIRASGDTTWIVTTQQAFDAFFMVAEGVKGKALDALVAEHGVAIPLSVVTKQRIQFIQGTISDEDTLYTRHEIEARVLDLVNATELKEFVPNYGMRFPCNQCAFCAYRGLCFHDEDLVWQLLERGAADWMETEVDGE